MGMIEGGRSCKTDQKCSEKQYCYDVSGQCVDYTQCERYNRQEGVRPARHPNQCGSCLAGYADEIIGNGERSQICTKISVQDNVPESVGMNNETMIGILVVAVGVFVAAGVLSILLKKHCLGKHDNNRKRWRELCRIGPTAPPAESSPFIGYRDQANPPAINNNHNLKDKNILVTATPFKDPDWVRSNPNYGHHLSDDSLNAPGQSHTAIQLPHDGNATPNNWAPEQLTIELPDRSLTEFATEHRDNAMNSVLVQRNYSPASTAPESNNNDSTFESSDAQDNRERNRASNVLISQKITMNVNLINGDC